jgi:negative regulator of sigma-B (phosphoserine phosphatase)
MDSVSTVDIDYFVAEKPLESVNGDAAFVNVDQKKIFVGVIDGAGHGPEAHAVAQTARNFLEKNRNEELPSLMQELHEELRGTRGGVAIIGNLDIERLQFRYVGIGNIVLRKFGAELKREIIQGGVIGHHVRTPKERILQLSHGDVLVMHTDGISSHFSLDDYPHILWDDAETIANNLIKKFGKNDDDATNLIIRLK